MRWREALSVTEALDLSGGEELGCLQARGNLPMQLQLELQLEQGGTQTGPSKRRTWEVTPKQGGLLSA
ncbi:hypothetical protein NDU88_001083 [Pleurodeles waltl]|uniref:Uncharacterized protein n=1 Tax=Pleurodeles waltl TaxID=8319 RepID=A0AAV7THA5_PLEWA|nr:hypothetical protein NDU88_001083 [Pleurodeles waltl]